MRKLVLGILLLLFVYAMPTVVLASDLTITAIGSANWGDSTLLESNGEYLLIDVTGGEVNDVFNYLESNNISKFDLYLSHYHWDHYGRDNQMKIENQTMSLMEYFMRTYDIGTLYLPDDTAVIDNSGVLSIKNRLIEVANDMSIEVVILTRGSKFQFGSTSAEVLYVNKDSSIESLINNSSLVTMFTNGNTKYLNAGDIEQYTENKILDDGINISADIFKLSHHGLNYESGKYISNTANFINAIKPKYSYFMHNNPKNLYKCQSSLDNLSSFSNVYMTGVNGNITFVVEDDVITPIAEKNVNTLTINYVDKETNKILDTKTYQFNAQLGENTLKYYLYDYEKKFPNYAESDGNTVVPQSGVLDTNIVYTLYYSKVPDKIFAQFIDEYKKNETLKEYENLGFDVELISTSNSIKLIAINGNETYITNFTYDNGILTYVTLDDGQLSFEKCVNDALFLEIAIETIANLNGYDITKLHSWLEKKHNSLTLDKDGIEIDIEEYEFTIQENGVTSISKVDKITSFKLDLNNGIKTFDNNYKDEKDSEVEQENNGIKDEEEQEEVNDEGEIENPKTFDRIISVMLLGMVLFVIILYSYKRSRIRA